MRRRCPGELFFLVLCISIRQETTISVRSLKGTTYKISRLVSFFFPHPGLSHLNVDGRGGNRRSIMHHFLLGFHNSDCCYGRAPLGCRLFSICSAKDSSLKLLLLIRTRKVQLPSSAQEFPSSWDATVCTALVAINAGLGGRKDPSWHFMIVRLHFL